MNDYNKQSITNNARDLVENHGKKAAEIVRRRIKNLPSQHSRDGDLIFMLLTEVEKLLEKEGS